MTSCQSTPKPPIAKVEPHPLVMHGDTRVDPYYWLRDRENPEVIAYLEAENAHTEGVMAHTQALQEQLFEEIKGRIKKDDSSVPYRDRDFYYYTRYETGAEYAIHCRKRGSLEAEEEVLFDGNALAEGHDYFALGGPTISANQDIAAFSIDIVGRRQYTLRFKNLTTGEIYPEEIPNVTGNVAWAADNATIFYTQQDPETLRWARVLKHRLGDDPANDALVFEEADETFGVSVGLSKNREQIFVASWQTVSTEFRILPANAPDSELRVVLPRERDHEYDCEVLGDDLYIRTNKDAKNFRLVRTPLATPEEQHWQEVVAHRGDTLLEDFDLFDDYLVLEERYNGLTQIRVRPWADPSQEHTLDFGEPTYLAYIGTNPNLDSKILRYGYTSLTTPSSVYDYDMATRSKTLLKEEEVIGDFDRNDYRTERLFGEARDGTSVPISLVYHVDTQLHGASPLLLYAYGSYGASMDATFSPARLSLLDRGFVFAIAHIRGGEELGRAWYEGGKLLTKKNTFTDFIDCAKTLVEKEYADPKRVYAMGGSAGGLLMGAVINMNPECFHGVVAEVPFVDIVTTMLDEDIPLTTSEYDEWGNPNDKVYYDYMLSYSPYDNVEAKAYPHLLVTTGLHDSQVQYWEPAKWVAKLRATKTDDNLLLMKTNMDAGHGGASGRFRRYREVALIYAFLLDLAGKRV